MKAEFWPYYLSRAVLSGGFALITFGFSLTALIFGLSLFGLFLVYLHSGWFPVNHANPLFPLRRDEHAREIQRRALVAAVICGALILLLSRLLAGILPWPPLPISTGLGIVAVVYFLVQFTLFVRA